jgi:hypothetical protein
MSVAASNMQRLRVYELNARLARYSATQCRLHSPPSLPASSFFASSLKHAYRPQSLKTPIELHRPASRHFHYLDAPRGRLCRSPNGSSECIFQCVPLCRDGMYIMPRMQVAQCAGQILLRAVNADNICSSSVLCTLRRASNLIHLALDKSRRNRPSRVRDFPNALHPQAAPKASAVIYSCLTCNSNSETPILVPQCTSPPIHTPSTILPSHRPRTPQLLQNHDGIPFRLHRLRLRSQCWRALRCCNWNWCSWWRHG